VFISIAEVVLAELAGGVALGLEQLGDGHIAGLQALRGAGHADLGVARAQTALAGNERGAPRRAALLGVVVRENHAFLGEPVNVGCSEAHQSHRIGADVGLADVVAPDDDDVGFLVLRLRVGSGKQEARRKSGGSVAPRPVGGALLFFSWLSFGFGLVRG
jgi:hypothetical protein